MIVDLGLLALVIAALAALYAFVMAILGGTQQRPAVERTPGRRDRAVVDFDVLDDHLLEPYRRLQLEYAYRVSNSTTPAFLRITALWGGQNGSILFWNWLMSLYIFFVFLRPWKSNRDLLPWVIAVSIGTQAFFILLTPPIRLRAFVRRCGRVLPFAPPAAAMARRQPAHAVPGLRRVGDPLCVCDGGADRQEQDR
jgi:cytochrome c-type biogenesis protein CcmF